jgi:error-prone DNA polymerase
MEDFSRRAGVGEKALAALASAGAFDGLEPTRRSSLWKARGLRKEDPDVFLSVPEGEVAFEDLGEFEKISWDYESSSHSTHGHPLAPLRASLKAQGLPDARTVARMTNGRRVRYAGLVICRQRPGTASGVTFMTLEDETGFVNLVIWSQKFSEYALLIKTTTFLGATGKVQAESGVVHLVVDELWKPRLALEPSKVRSRDFH